MLTMHEDIEMTCGDEWQVVGQLLDESGGPLDLVEAITLNWTLLGPDGARVAGIETASVERMDPATGGKVLITVPTELTRTFRPGRYTNAIRVVIGDAPSTLWRGQILANADPFYLVGLA